MPSVSLGHNEICCDPERHEWAKKREIKQQMLNKEWDDHVQDQELYEEQDDVVGSFEHETGTPVQTDITQKDMAALEFQNLLLQKPD